jgi:uncharacterized protein YjbI with pentapeptide repeats
MALPERYICENFANQSLNGLDAGGLFINCTFAGSNLSQSNLHGTFMDVSFRDATLAYAKLSGTFASPDFTNADLAFADLRGSRIQTDELKGAYSLRGAIMPNGNVYRGELGLAGD